MQQPSRHKKKQVGTVGVETQDEICEHTNQNPMVLPVKSKKFFRVFGIFEGPQSFLQLLF